MDPLSDMITVTERSVACDNDARNRFRCGPGEYVTVTTTSSSLKFVTHGVEVNVPRSAIAAASASRHGRNGVSPASADNWADSAEYCGRGAGLG